MNQPASCSRLRRSSAGIAALLATLGTSIAAPVAMTGAGSYTENFDTLPQAPTATNVAVAWTNDTNLSGWYAENSGAALVNIVAGNGSSNSGQFYAYGTAASAERAMGTLGSGTPANAAFGVLLQNTSAGTLVIDSIAYTGEQWRNGGNVTAQKLTFSYQKSGSPITSLSPVNALPGGWTAISALDFTSPIATATAAALDGNDSANQAAISTTPSLSVAAGEYVFLRWHDPNDAGNDHGLGIDNLTISWSASGTPSLTVGATPTNFSENAGATASVGTVSIPTALGSDLTVNLSSSDTTEATVPASVTITTGNTSANFDIAAVDDFLADGNQSATITATASGYLDGQVGLTIEEDSDAPINVSVLPSSFSESSPGPVTGTVTVAEAVLSDLTVNLSSGDVSEATVPPTVTITTGNTFAEFPVTPVDDTDVDGTRNVTIFASATGYTNGSVQIQVTDDGDLPPAPTIPVNGIAFTGYNADGDDNVAFVALVPIAEGDVIIFTDNEWNGSDLGSGGGFVDTNEGTLTWTAPVGGIAEGTVVTLDNVSLGTRTASVGTLTGSNFALAAGGDTIYAIQGAVLSPTRVLAAISANTDVITGTGLTDHVVLATGTDIGAYNGSRSSQTTYANYLSLIHDEATNWITQDTGSNDGIDTVAPDVPFDTTVFTLSTGSNYSSWASTNSTAQTIDLDHDGDGVSNGVEYFLGGNTNTTGFTATPGVVNTAGTLSVTWTKAADYVGVYGTDFVVETSSTLSGAWTTETLGVNVVITGNDVKYTFPAGTKNFARLKVTGP